MVAMAQSYTSLQGGMVVGDPSLSLKVLEQKLLKRAKLKKVTWATDDKLRQIRLFSSEDSPSLAGNSQQDSNLKERDKALGMPDLPPGFGPGKSKRVRTDSAAVNAVVAQIPWRKPDLFQLNPEWQVVAGGESQEIATQQQREKRALEAIYPYAAAVPDSPAEPQDPQEPFNDDLTPVIPLLPTEDDEMLDADEEDGDDGKEPSGAAGASASEAHEQPGHPQPAEDDATQGHYLHARPGPSILKKDDDRAQQAAAPPPASSLMQHALPGMPASKGLPPPQVQAAHMAAASGTPPANHPLAGLSYAGATGPGPGAGPGQLSQPGQPSHQMYSRGPGPAQPPQVNAPPPPSAGGGLKLPSPLDADPDVAAAAAAAFAALSSNGSIDSQLLVQILNDPQMVASLMAKQSSNGGPPLPAPLTSSSSSSAAAALQSQAPQPHSQPQSQLQAAQGPYLAAQGGNQGHGLRPAGGGPPLGSPPGGFPAGLPPPGPGRMPVPNGAPPPHHAGPLPPPMYDHHMRFPPQSEPPGQSNRPPPHMQDYGAPRPPPPLQQPPPRRGPPEVADHASPEQHLKHLIEIANRATGQAPLPPSQGQPPAPPQHSQQPPPPPFREYRPPPGGDHHPWPPRPMERGAPGPPPAMRMLPPPQAGRGRGGHGERGPMENGRHFPEHGRRPEYREPPQEGGGGGWGGRPRRVCAFYNTEVGCKNGAKCPFVHETSNGPSSGHGPHAGRGVKRPYMEGR
eukprot:jgi/Mesen1/9187/ME000591S08513